MPFRPVNGPTTFIAFIHNINSMWKRLATLHSVIINEDTKTNIIVDDIVSVRILTAECKAFSLANLKGKAPRDWVIRSLDD